MKIYFKPSFGLTVCTIPSFIILLLLGSWQIQRLSWKSDLISNYNINFGKNPISVEELFQNNEENKYRRVTIKGKYNHENEIQIIGKTYEGNAGYHIVTPFLLKNDDISINLKIEYIRRINKKFYSKILDINDVDEIKKYTNTKLFIDYNDLPELPKNETYLHDLIGMIVIDQNLDEILGVVDGLNNYGADDCIIVKPSINSVDKQERLIPFIKDKFIKSVDKKKRVIKVDWQKDF